MALILFRLMVHASEEDQDGRYFSKKLHEVDQLSLVRDRNGQAKEEDEDEAEDEAEDVGSDIKEEEGITEKQEDRPSGSRKQLDMEDEWGLRRSRPASVIESEDGGEESETDSYERDEDYKVSHKCAYRLSLLTAVVRD